MQYIGIQTMKLPSGGYKAYFWGQSNNHIFDWTGCNYRLATVPEQPRLGFESREAAEAFVRTRFKTKDEAKAACPHHDGTHLGTAQEKQQIKDVKLPSAQKAKRR